MKTDGKLIWVAYCITCSKQLQACPNGAITEAAATMHLEGWGFEGHQAHEPHPDHRVLVGYEVEVNA